MNDVEKLLLNEMQMEKFQSIVSDDFSFVDSMMDQEDLDSVFKTSNNEKEVDDNAY